MASGVYQYGLFQDQNSAVHYCGAPLGGKTDNSKVPRKGGASGRKPLGDLSNSVKPNVPPAPKKLNSDISSAWEEHAFSKSIGPSKKKIISNALEKKVTVGGRKALSDISNSGKPHLPGTSRKTLKVPERLVTVSEEPIFHETVSEECFLHNHGECLKAQKISMDFDEFFKVVGLNNEYLHQPASPCKSQPTVNILNSKTPSGVLDIEEMDEQLLMEEEKEDRPSSLKFQSSAYCKSPKLSGHKFGWTNYDSVNFSLMETPKKL